MVHIPNAQLITKYSSIRKRQMFIRRCQNAIDRYVDDTEMSRRCINTFNSILQTVGQMRILFSEAEWPDLHKIYSQALAVQKPSTPRRPPE